MDGLHGTLRKGSKKQHVQYGGTYVEMWHLMFKAEMRGASGLLWAVSPVTADKGARFWAKLLDGHRMAEEEQRKSNGKTKRGVHYPRILVCTTFACMQLCHAVSMTAPCMMVNVGCFYSVSLQTEAWVKSLHGALANAYAADLPWLKAEGVVNIDAPLCEVNPYKDVYNTVQRLVKGVKGER